MIAVEQTPDGIINACLAHLFIGMLKADGDITLNEEVKLDDLIQDNESNLPVDTDKLSDTITSIVVDLDYKESTSMDHLQRSLEYLVIYSESKQDQGKLKVDAIQMLLEDLMKVDNITSNENDYLQYALKEIRANIAS